MSDAQTWAIVLPLASMMVTLVGIVVVMPVVNARTIGRELGARIDGLDAKVDSVERRLDAKIDGVERRLDAKIDGAEERLSTRIHALADLTDARFSEVGHRLAGLEGDMALVKGHLIGQASA